MKVTDAHPNAQSIGELAVGYTFTRIADTQTGFATLSCCPRLNDSGVVVFSGTTPDGTTGVFTGSGGPTTTIADSSAFLSFGAGQGADASPAINGYGVVAFTGTRVGGVQGVFTGDGESVMTIADSTTNLNGFAGSVINDDGTVGFRAFVGPGDSGGIWIYTGNGGPLTAIASNRGSRFYEVYLPSAINSLGTVAFEAGLWLNGLSSGGPGFFVGNRDTLTTIMVTNQFDPQSPFRGLGDFRPSLNQQGAVVFSAQTTAGTGLFVNDAGTVSVVADPAGPLSIVGFPIINDLYQVVFQARTSVGNLGLYSGPNPLMDKVVQGGDPVDGAILSGLDVGGTSLNNAGQIAFVATLSDGTRAVFRADPVGLADRIHPIARGVRDSAGNTSGMGSWYFTVANP
jgi:hypothetical protein